MDITSIKTLGELKRHGYQHTSLKTELRNNLIASIANGEDPFPGIVGYEKTVRPQVERAILAGHNILLLGLRGQAKTRFARLLVNLLDEYVPVIAGSELNEDPFAPLTANARQQLASLGDDLPIEWLHRDARLVEKLATPDVSVADLIGDIDPIKAANLKLAFSDEGVIHYGLIPRANRGIFIINELPDLQPRIQVSLFNILQEQDIQIRGFNLRIPLDMQFVFTANPEDYTNRGNIITPLKDRIESQIITHYPDDIKIGKKITEQEAVVTADIVDRVHIPEMARDLLEVVTMVARQSEYIDQSSGVSARLPISAMEQLYAAAELRMLRAGESTTTLRVTDFIHIIPSMTGKLELVYEGEQLGAEAVSRQLIEIAIESIARGVLPNPNKFEEDDQDPFGTIRAYFSNNTTVALDASITDAAYHEKLDEVAGLKNLMKRFFPHDERDEYFVMELGLHALCAYEMLQRSMVGQAISFEDPLQGLF